MSFKPKNEPTNPLFRNLKIMKLKDILAYKNCTFVQDQINENMPESFYNFFTTATAQHIYNTRGSPNNTIIKATTNSVTYGLNSLKQRGASDWNGRIKHFNTMGIDRQEILKKTYI